ncbi:hypothetical protein [Microbacterium sp. Clip185]|uniref:hypothetical protein n=1 Tax=Microbacterium sp. Clip185 TaxID=3025663 RepID=UPI002366AA9B|nr:hypothetical protein [Microbacterium sp. Clip185]WDG17006.1 hypothetical protein PQV94_10180 [Microbacterium sp. Clip185]
MPFRSKATLETWLEEFHRSREAGDLIRVAVQDGSEGADTGLVIVPLHNADISLYMEPIEVGDSRWRVTIEPQAEMTVLTSFEMQRLAAELSVAAELCAFLEAKSVGHEEG